MKIPLKKRYYNKLQIMTALQDICTQEQLTGIEARLMETQCDDVEEVTRCMDCIYHYDSQDKQGKTICYCEMTAMFQERDHFCADGEKMEG